MTDNLDLAKSVGAYVVEGGVLFIGYEQLEKYTQAATLAERERIAKNLEMRGLGRVWIDIIRSGK